MRKQSQKRPPLPQLPIAAGDDWREHRRDIHLGDFVTSASAERTGVPGAGAFLAGFLRGAGYLRGKIPVFRLEGPNGEERLLPVGDAILPAAGYCYRQAEDKQHG